MKNNEFLVRVKGYDKNREIMLVAFYTDNLFEYIKIIDYMQTNNIPLSLPNDDDVAKEYKDCSFEIFDFSITIGSNISTTCLDIWVEL